MGSLGRARNRRLLRLLALSAVVVGAVVTLASAAGPGGWDHLGDGGTSGSDSLNLVASALTVTPGALYVGGEFTDAGGIPEGDRIATWNGSSWNAVSSPASQISNGRVFDIAVSGGKVYAGGSFTNAGGDDNADFLAVWDGVNWKPFCTPTGPGPAFDGNVTSLEIVGPTLYVGGEFHNGAGIASADYLLACALAGGASSPAVSDPAHPFSSSVYALTADSNGTLYAGGGFTDLENLPAADAVAYLPAGGAWHAMGTGTGTCGCAVPFVRSLTAVGTDVYVGTDADDIAGIAQADHVARWDGSEWHALGADSSGVNGWFPVGTFIYALAGTGSNLCHRGVPERERRRARRQHRLLRRHRMAPGRVQRCRRRPVERQRPGPRHRRPPALCGRELHQRRRRPPGALRRLVRADADHRLSDADGDRGPGPRPHAHGDPQPGAASRA